MIIDGKTIAEGIKKDIKKTIEKLKEKPCLAILLAGEDKASQTFVRIKQRECGYVGIKSTLYKLSENIKEDKIISLIKRLNEDDNIHAIIAQLPLPKHIDQRKILKAISPKKDVDGITPENLGRLFINDEHLVPCTPKGIIKLLENYKIDVRGKDVVIINRSNIVGKPLALMLLHRNATVTVCHSRTKNLKEKTKNADILITATGMAKMIKGDMIKEGAVVIDAGTSYVDDKLCGDVDFDDVKDKASYITPVPGGVGPMTVSMILENTLLCFEGCKK